jgi:hypothetical protein
VSRFQRRTSGSWTSDSLLNGYGTSTWQFPAEDVLTESASRLLAVIQSASLSSAKVLGEQVWTSWYAPLVSIDGDILIDDDILIGIIAEPPL